MEIIESSVCVCVCVNDIIKGGYFVLRESISMRNFPEMWVLILIKVGAEGGS